MPKVTFAKTGAVLECEPGMSFLDLCQENGAPHDFGCTVGSCGTCRLEITTGAENVQPCTDDEKETVEMCTDVEGARLGCQLKIQGDITVQPVD